MADVYAEEAHRIVDAAIENACKRLSSISVIDDEGLQRDISEKNDVDEKQDTEHCHEKTKNADLPNVQWINIENFTIEEGLLKIEEFLQTWQCDENWLHCINYLKQEELPYSTRYRYEVKWSIPTRRKPIPRATASTYFTLDVSKIKPKNSPVEVYYVFEGHRLVHRPGESRFNEKWLKDIIESKIHLMSFITF